ncbi:related to RRP1 - involved in processing rRNA precursor species to mature rRNAs [Ustilago sp. UG-2017b]|nr:related to RRP1 - involved in processing rRNA precursor species to mature rRNAs [Ustilago sp. UG-2017b]
MLASTSAAASSSKRKPAPTASGSKSKKPKSSSSATTATKEDASIPLGKALASTEKRIRDYAVRSLHSFLATNGAHTIPDLELQKLWKGLFYCFWMSDKPLVQQRLANDLAQLVLVHPSSSTSSTSSTSTTSPDEEGGMSERALAGLKFLEAFWDTIVSEWGALDKHRIDKFYLLVRRFVASGFQLLAEEGWNLDATRRFAQILGKFQGGVLSTNDPKVPDSLTYHLSDIYLDELEKVIEQVDNSQNKEEKEEQEEEEEEDLPLIPTLELLKPFVDALATAKSKAMYERIWSNVFHPLLEDTLRASAKEHDDLASDDQDQVERPAESKEEEEEGGDETANGTEFHSFADEQTLNSESESEPCIPDSDSDQEDEEAEGEDDVKHPLLLALSAVPIPSAKEDVEEEAEVDVALLLRKAIFQALFTAASRKDATDSRRRLLYQLWRDEQDRLNEKAEEESDDDDDDE